MRSKMKFTGFILLVLSVALFTSCVKDSVEEPSPLGPSGFAISLSVSSNPNVLFAGAQSREMTTVTAVLKKFDGTPLAGRTIFFELRDALTSLRADGIGYFDGYSAVASRVTDGSGRVTIDYHGPTVSELMDSLSDNFYVTAHVAWQGAESLTEWTPIYFVRDFNDLIFNVEVDPNVLWCTSKRPQSTITVFFAVPDGTPIVGRKVFFEILQGKGLFQDNKTKTYRETNSSGYATLIYKGPTAGEMTSGEEWVKIRVQPETWWEAFDGYGVPPDKYYLHVEFSIRLKKGS
jgi:hypothetical protein